jgi:hypothetical protein
VFVTRFDDSGLRFNKEKWLLKVNDEEMTHL